MKADPEHAPIYERLLSHCPQYVFGAPWDQLTGSDADAFHGPGDAAAVLTALQAEFSDDLLRQSGVAVLGPDNSLTLDPALTGPDAVIVALRTTAQAPPFELLTGEGCLSGTEFPVMAVLGDRMTNQPEVDLDEALCVAFAIADVATLRALGVPATLATGLHELSRAPLEEFCRRFDLRDRPRPAPSGRPAESADWMAALEADGPAAPNASNATQADPRELIFITWSPATLSLKTPEGLQPVQEHFAQLGRHLEFRLTDVHAWRPTGSQLETLRFRLEFGDIEDVREALLASLDHSAGMLVAPAGSMSKVFGPVADHATATSHLQEIRGRGGDKHLSQKAWQNYEQSLERDVIGPLIQEALDTPDPVQRNLKLALAETARLLHMQSALTAERLARSVSEAGVQRTEGIPQAEIQKVLTMTDRLTNLAKELKKCPKPPRVTIDMTPGRKEHHRDHRGLPDSGSQASTSSP